MTDLWDQTALVCCQFLLFRQYEIELDTSDRHVRLDDAHRTVVVCCQWLLLRQFWIERANF